MSVEKTPLLLILIGLAASYAGAQTAVEAAAMSANSGIGTQVSGSNAPGQSITESLFDPGARQAAATSPKQGTHGSLIAPAGPPPDEVNRKQMEQNAGKDGGRVLFRSTPSGAEIFVGRLLVGRTPLLMFMAPGRYDIEMRGTRQESGHRILGVMPKETQTLLIDLTQRYPATVSIRW